jgi:DnaJ-class molecular chaperone
MQEKSFDEVVNEYQRRKMEGMGKFRTGHWEKCSMCGGSMSAPCDNCKGTGRMPGQPKRVNSETPLWGTNEICPVCKGEGKIKCRNPQCRNGSVWVNE